MENKSNNTLLKVLKALAWLGAISSCITFIVFLAYFVDSSKTESSFGVFPYLLQSITFTINACIAYYVIKAARKYLSEEH